MLLNYNEVKLKMEKETERIIEECSRTIDEMFEMLPDYFYYSLLGEFVAARGMDYITFAKETGDWDAGTTIWHEVLFYTCRKFGFDSFYHMYDLLSWDDADCVDAILQEKLADVYKEMTGRLCNETYYRYICDDNEQARDMSYAFDPFVIVHFFKKTEDMNTTVSADNDTFVSMVLIHNMFELKDYLKQEYPEHNDKFVEIADRNDNVIYAGDYDTTAIVKAVSNWQKNEM